MSGAPSILADLLADCDTHGIRLALAGDDGLTIDAPQDALTPNLLDRLKAHKGELLAMLLTATEQPVATSDTPAKPTEPTKPVCRCGSTAWRNVPIHGGQSTRRDCAKCRRFIGFPIWHSKNTGQKGQY